MNKTQPVPSQAGTDPTRPHYINRNRTKTTKTEPKLSVISKTEPKPNRDGKFNTQTALMHIFSN